jgi:hypothetical protein
MDGRVKPGHDDLGVMPKSLEFAAGPWSHTIIGGG